MKRTALIVGATGLVGSNCLKTLLTLDAYEQVHVLARRELNLELNSKEQEKLKIHLVNFDQLEAAEIVFAVDDVFCCLGTTLKQAGSIEAFKKVDYDYCLKAAQLAAKHSVKHFLIVTAVNANAKSLTYYSSTKGKLQSALIALNFTNLSIFQPSLLLGERKDFRLMESLSAKGAWAFNQLLPKKLNKYKAIKGEVVGESMAMLAANFQKQKKSNNTVEFYYYDDMQHLINS